MKTKWRERNQNFEGNLTAWRKNSFPILEQNLIDTKFNDQFKYPTIKFDIGFLLAHLHRDYDNDNEN